MLALAFGKKIQLAVVAEKGCIENEGEDSYCQSSGNGGGSILIKYIYREKINK